MIPSREVARNNGQTYFVTSNTVQRKPFFRHERWSRLFLEVLEGYRPERYLLHGFVLMPDHFHILITPRAGLELAVQCVKGGFSFRAKRAFNWTGDIWATGFSDHRIRDEEDLGQHAGYIANNPVKAMLVDRAEQYPYCSSTCSFELDAVPPGLKPNEFIAGATGAAEVAPFQSPVQSSGIGDAATFQSSLKRSWLPKESDSRGKQ